MFCIGRIAILLIISASLSAPVVAQERFALVIGNQRYNDLVGPLRNPHNDIALVGKALSEVGFEVLAHRKDATRDEILFAVLDLAARVKTAGRDAVTFLYYAGHGVSVGGENVLIPVNVENTTDAMLSVRGVRLGEILDILKREAPEAVHFVVLDACRNVRGQRGGRGFVAVNDRRKGIVIAFATAEGETATDEGKSSAPYAAALATELSKPGRTDQEVFNEVRARVVRETQKQTPWTHDGLVGQRIIFKAIPILPAPVAPLPNANSIAKHETEIEITFWSSVRDSKSTALLQTYIDRYPQGHFITLANAIVEQLKREEAARESVAKSQAAVEAADKAAKAAGSDQRKAEEAAKKGEQIAKAEAKEARESLDKANADKATALAALAEAKREADEARSAQNAKLKEAEKEEKIFLANPVPPPSTSKPPAAVPPSQELGPGPLRVQTANAKPLRTVATSKDGALLAVSGDDGRIRLWNANDLKVSRTLEGHQDKILSLAFSPDGKLLASAGWDSSIRIWHLATGAFDKFDTGADRLFCITFDPKGQYVLAGDAKGHAQIWHLARKARSGKPADLDGHVRAISFVPDMSGTFASIGSSGKMRIRSWKKGMRDIDAHSGGGFYVGYSPSGEFLLTAGGDKKLKLWRSDDLKMVRTFEGHSKYVLAAAFSPDGKQIISAGGDRSLLLWDVSSGEQVRQFLGHTGDVQSVAFYKDGTKVVSVGEDKAMRVWEVATGRQLATAVAFTDGEYVAYMPDGKYTGSPGVHSRLKIIEEGAERAIDQPAISRLFVAGLPLN